MRPWETGRKRTAAVGQPPSVRGTTPWCVRLPGLAAGTGTLTARLHAADSGTSGVMR